MPNIVSDVEDLVSNASNPITGMLAGVKIAGASLPTIVKVGGNIIQHLPDIQNKFAALEAALQKAYADAKDLDLTSSEADLGAAWKAGMAAYDDVGLPHSVVQTVIAVAANKGGAPASGPSVVNAFESIGRRLGMPI